MPNRALLPDSRIEEALPDLPGWEFRENRLRKEYKFPDFVTAWAFMSGCAIEAQTMDHHPNWSNVYDRVSVELWTHDAGGVTGMDLELARRFEAMARRVPPTTE